MMRYTVTEIIGEEPVTAEAVQERLKLLPAQEDEDLTLNPMIKAAREYCENIAGMAFIEQRITAYPEIAELAAGYVNLPRPPIIEIESVKAYAEDGTSADLTGYVVDGEDGRMTMPVNAEGLRSVNPIAVTYRAGGSCPELARQAMLLLIGHWMQNRESVQTGAVTAVEIAQTTRDILKQYKRWW